MRPYIQTVLLLLLFVNAKAQICFTSSSRYTIGPVNPGSVATGDFDNDGNMDIAVSDYTAASATVMYGNGTDTFTVQHTLALPSPVASFAADDINHDTLTDLIFVSDSVYIYKSYGISLFNRVSFPLPYSGYAVVSGDFNNDNNKDIVVTLSGASFDSIAFLAGDGAGNFLPAVLSASAASGGIIRAAEINNDNKPDVALLNNNGILILNGTGAGYFIHSQMITLPTGATNDYQFGDLNGDNFADLVVSDATMPGLRVFLNDGTGTFSQEVDFTGGCPSSLAIADFDLDGKNDVVVTGCSALGYGLADVHFGDGIGSFTHFMQYECGQSPYRIAVADFNNDGRMDITTGNAFQGPNVSVLLNSTEITGLQIVATQPLCPGQFGSAFANITGTSPSYQYSWQGPSGTDTSATSVNMQAGIYIVKVTAAGGCHVFDGTQIISIPAFNVWQSISNTGCSSGTLVDVYGGVNGATPPYTFSWNTSPPQLTQTATGLSEGEYILTITDANGCMNNDTLTVPANILFDSGTSYSVAATHPEFVTSGDFNNDVAKDLATLNNDNSISIFINNGLGIFQSPTVIPLISGNNNALKAIDVTGDNKTDLVIARNNSIWVFPGDGIGGFGMPSVTPIMGISRISDFTAGDFDGDNKTDLLAAADQNTEVYVLIGNNTGSFAVNVQYNVMSLPLHIATADFNHDNKLDFVIGTYGSECWTFNGNGNGSFNTGNYHSSAGGEVQLFTTDINSDGNQDLICGGTNKSSVIFTDSTGTFSAPNYYDYVFFPIAGTHDDMNNDGINADVIYADNNADKFYILTCDTSGNYDVPLVYNTGANVSSITTGDFNVDGYPDVAITFPDSDYVKVYMNCTLTSVEELKNEYSLSTYPNPAHSKIFFSEKYSDKAVLIIYDSEGKKVVQKNVVDGNGINIENLPTGIYFLRLTDSEKVYKGKISVVR